MGYWFKCRYCSHGIVVETLRPGEPYPCPACGQVVTVPEDAEVTDGRIEEPAGRRHRDDPWHMFAFLTPLFNLLGILDLVIGTIFSVRVMAADGWFGLLLLAYSVVGAMVCFGLAVGVRLLLSMKEDLTEIRESLASPPSGR
jgi:hypothetical protein